MSSDVERGAGGVADDPKGPDFVPGASMSAGRGDDDRLSKREALMYEISSAMMLEPGPDADTITDAILAAGWVSPETLADRVARARAEVVAEALREHRDAFVEASESAPEYDADVWLAAADTLDGSADRIESGHDSEGGE